MDVLIPTINRHQPLSVTLASLASQEHPFNVIIADQSDAPIEEDLAISNLLRILRYRQHPVDVIHNPLRRGIAQQRDLLFRSSKSSSLLCLDDDVWLAPGALAVLSDAVETLECGFVGMPVIGLSHLDDVRHDEQRHLEFWEGKPIPEGITPDSQAWNRYQLHNAANPAHLNSFLNHERWRAYKIAWIGGCVLYQRSALEEVGGWSFWENLPTEHAGEDVAVQLQIMARRAGAGILPSFAFHQQVPTTIPNRQVQAYW